MGDSRQRNGGGIVKPREPERYCVFDVEGTAAKGDFQGCAVVSDRRSVYHTDPHEAMRDLAEHAADGYTLAAHNAEYDIMCLQWPFGERVKLEYYSHKLSAALWYYDPDKPPAKIIDSLALAAGLGIAAIGDSIGYPKLETPQRLLGIDPDRYKWICEPHSVGECEPCYAIRDAEIALRYLNALREYCGQYDLPVRRKLAGIAVRLWQTLDRPEDVRLRSLRADIIAREGYHGGRVEAFRYGNLGRTYVYDVKSMYPSIMLTSPMPDNAKLRIFDKGPVSSHYLQYEGFSDATVTIPPLPIPPLPVSHDGRLFFPVGRVRGVFSHCELREAIQDGATVETIHRTVCSAGVIYPFTQYVTVLGEQRGIYKKAGDSREQVVKVLMNALYGRLGLTKEQTLDIVEPLRDGEKMHDFPGLTVDVIGGRLARRQTHHINRPSDTSNVLWAGTITAYARLQLYRLMKSAPSHVVYCDTDGVYTDADCLPVSDGMGGLELRGVYDKATIHGPKLYRLEAYNGEKMVRAKGVPRAFAETYLDTGFAEYRQPGRVLQAFRQDVTPSVWTILHKEAQLVPAKRTLTNLSGYQSGDGWSDTIPVVFGDDGPEGDLDRI
jgi:hypothetical protein